MSSFLPGGLSSTILLGAVSAVASAFKSGASKVIVEPSVLRIMLKVGAPLLMFKTYRDIVMEEKVGASILAEADISSLYLDKGLISLVHRPEETISTEKRLLSIGLNKEEAQTITLALSRPHDKLFLRQSIAREVAEEFDLKPFHPFMILVDSLRGGIINSKRFSELGARLAALIR